MAEKEAGTANVHRWTEAVCSVFLWLVLICAAWLAVSWIISDWGTETPDAKMSLTALDVEASVSQRLGIDPASIRTDFRTGGILDIYVSRSAFETVPYPDRESFVRQYGEKWCRVAKQKQGLRLPKMRFRDVRTGEVMASCGCLTKWVKIE